MAMFFVWWLVWGQPDGMGGVGWLVWGRPGGAGGVGWLVWGRPGGAGGGLLWKPASFPFN